MQSYSTRTISSNFYHLILSITLSAAARTETWPDTLPRDVTLTKMTSNSLQLCVPFYHHSDLMRFRCESITALAMTDHKGGSTTSLSSLSSLSSSTISSLSSLSSTTISSTTTSLSVVVSFFFDLKKKKNRDKL